MNRFLIAVQPAIEGKSLSPDFCLIYSLVMTGMTIGLRRVVLKR